MVKKSLLVILGLLLLLTATLGINTLRKGSLQLQVPALARFQIDKAAAANRLAQAVRLRTVRANSEDLKRFHGTNERLGVDNYADAIRFYHRLISELAVMSIE